MTAQAPQALPPAAVLYQMAIGHYVSRALHLAAKLKLADTIAAGARSAEELASASGADPSALRRVLRLLASAGVFTENEGGAFALTPLGSALRSDVPGSAWAMVMLFTGIGIQDAWKELEYCVRTGQPAFRKRSPTGDAFSQFDAEQAAIFDRAMATFAPQSAAAIAAAYDFSQFASLMDVGGGNGALMIGILRANPKLRGIVFDRPEVEAGARKNLEEAGLAARCDFVAGDFFRSIPASADAILTKHVIHDWNDEQATAILRNCRKALPGGAKLLIAEGVYPARIDTSLPSRGAAANDVNMLVSTGGRQRSEQEFRALYEAGGFALTKIFPTENPGLCVIEGLAR
ncbi:MAG TPA: methyltransferase [Myxococcota bacterium]|nr:methyltransferase [Myxococcota bacterium]